jgi:hypothetical protein
MSTAAYAVAHTVLPNLMKLKGIALVVGAIERKDSTMFDQVWAQVPHKPDFVTAFRGAYQLGILTLPKPSQMGEAHMCAFVAKKGQTTVARYFLLEHTYVLSTKSEQTIISERDGAKQVQRGPGPKLTGDVTADMVAFADAVMLVVEPPPQVTRR